MLFRRRLKKATKEQETEFEDRMLQSGAGFRDKLAMVIAAFLIIVLPCALILFGFGFLILFLFGAL